MLTLPATVAFSFLSEGVITFLPLIYAFGIVPIAELFLPPDAKNLSDAEREVVSIDPYYDRLLYLMLPLQWGFLIWFLFALTGGSEMHVFDATFWGRTTAMGMLCGVIGINVAHELGHRPEKRDQARSKALLLTSLYMHFFIEHNRGHHRNVATPDDPATSRKGEIVYVFWIRSIVHSWLHAWKLEQDRLQRQGLKVISRHNEMLRFQLVQVVLIIAIAICFSSIVLLGFLLAAFFGMLLLETVNYIEHYGLLRHRKKEGRFERVMPWHSWNSNHVYGRLLLFELSRHSDHHYKASKPYQLLDHMKDAPQLPTGYPGMMILSLVPPLFFAIMRRHMANISKEPT